MGSDNRMLLQQELHLQLEAQHLKVYIGSWLSLLASVPVPVSHRSNLPVICFPEAVQSPARFVLKTAQGEVE